MKTSKHSIHSAGFTLIEVMVVLAIISILAAIAMPSYRDYVIRGNLMDAANGLSATRADMERYYQDNRTYMATGAFTPPCQPAAGSLTYGKFVITCNGAGTPTATTYTLTATGSGPVAGFSFTINQAGVQATPTAIAGWNSNNCATGWIMKRGQSC